MQLYVHLVPQCTATCFGLSTLLAAQPTTLQTAVVSSARIFSSSASESPASVLDSDPGPWVLLLSEGPASVDPLVTTFKGVAGAAADEGTLATKRPGTNSGASADMLKLVGGTTAGWNAGVFADKGFQEGMAAVSPEQAAAANKVAGSAAGRAIEGRSSNAFATASSTGTTTFTGTDGCHCLPLK